MYLKKLGALGLAVALSLAVVGCASATRDDQAADTDAATRAEKPAEPPSDDNSSSSTTTTVDDDPSEPSSDLARTLDSLRRGEPGDCLSAGLAYGAFVLAPVGFEGEFPGDATDEQIQEFEQLTRELEARIPPELKGDFETVATAYRGYAETIQDIDAADLLDPATQQKLRAAGERIDDPDVEAASDRIQSWFRDSCGS